MFTIGMLAMFFVGRLEPGTTKTVLSLVTGFVSSHAIGSMFAVAYSIPSQLAAEEEEKTNVTNSAMYFAVQGLFAGVASAIATGVVLVALKKASEGAEGTPAMTYMTLIAAAGTIISFILTFILPKHLMQLGRKRGKTDK